MNSEQNVKEQILKFTQTNRTVDMYAIANGLNMELKAVIELCNELMIEGKMGHFDYKDEPEVSEDI